ncbi:hypothetical protein ACGFYU_27550 [Streptomyces sp. NPDC048337]|uniref:hypothetical protein n=1 Tax=Streptomyces sp. NPDC048337 TaxID=3365535 RepID=UPI003714FC8F
MERYGTSDGPDPFACSMEAVKSLAARLSARETAELDHAAVEHLLAGEHPAGVGDDLVVAGLEDELLPLPGRAVEGEVRGGHEWFSLRRQRC